MGSGADKTIIDCEGNGVGAFFWYKLVVVDFVFCSGFILLFGYYTIANLTVRNCIATEPGSNGGGALVNNSGVYLDGTHWINNTAPNGGAVGLDRFSTLYTRGDNKFINNSATLHGGAVNANRTSFFYISGDEEFLSNSVGGSSSAGDANFFINTTSSLRYPQDRFRPKLASGPGQIEKDPVAYVDPSVVCASETCDGSKEHPFRNLHSALHTGATQHGGKIFLMPGVYGPNDANLTIANDDYSIQPWPDMTGEVIIDCKHQGRFLVVYYLLLKLSNITIQNCVNNNNDSDVNGGALKAHGARLTLSNVNFRNNSAPFGFGGALFVSRTSLVVKGGSFFNNSAREFGAAIYLRNCSGRLEHNTQFHNNFLLPKTNQQPVVNDVSCLAAAIQNDGTVHFQVDQLGRCGVEVSSPSTFAVFPGSLAGVLFPLNSTGDIQHDIYAVLQFDSVVELQNGRPIENTRLSKENLMWTLSTSNHSNQYLRLTYDAFGPNKQFVRVIHDFYIQDATVIPDGSTTPLSVKNGSIKTTIQIALWPFKEPGNSLMLTLITYTHAPIISLLPATPPDSIADLNADEVDFVLETEELTVNFGAVTFAIFDSIQDGRQPITLEAPHRPPNNNAAVEFRFIFGSFSLWTNFDPDFGVVLGNGNSGNQGDGETPKGLIIGLSIGLLAVACFVVVVVSVVVGVVTTVIRRRRRAKLMRRVVSSGVDAKKSGIQYEKLEETPK